MAQLINTFSWSFSAAADFDECRRRRFWSKYAMWGGWAKSAPAISQKAYMLNKMDNRYSIMGKAVEDSIMWILRQNQNGKICSAQDAYEQLHDHICFNRGKIHKTNSGNKTQKTSVICANIITTNLPTKPPKKRL